jgi:hypothetical protein
MDAVREKGGKIVEFKGTGGPVGLPTVMVDFSKTGLTDSDLESLIPSLKGMPHLRKLDLSDTKVTPDSVVRLKEVRQLTSLTLPEAAYQPAVIEELKKANQRLVIAGPPRPAGTKPKEP